MPKAPFTAEYLRSILDYDPVSGVFTWKLRADIGAAWNARWAGKRAGHLNSDASSNGYLKIVINGENYYGHRLAWLYATGNWPSDEIDHRLGDRPTTKLIALREATSQQNKFNRGKNRNNSSGFKGVCWENFTQRWKAEICIGRKRINLGRFDTPEAAHAAYCEAAVKLHGEFARTA